MLFAGDRGEPDVYLFVRDFSGGPGGTARSASARVAGDCDNAVTSDRDWNRAGAPGGQDRDRGTADVDVGRNPGQHTWGPITRTASSAGYTVRATAKVQRVVCAMGDRHTVTCTKRGTPYADSFSKMSSPDCGYIYTRQGTYTVRATSYWRVTWVGIGQSGTIPLDFTRTVVITMGEAQVLIR